MNIAVVFYSLEGHTKYLGEQLASRLDADLFMVNPRKPYPTQGFYKFFCAGRDSLFKRNITLEQPLPVLTSCERIILCTPVWAETTSSPMFSFLKQTDLSTKQLYLVATCSGGPTKRCFLRMRNEVHGAHILGEATFVEPGEETQQRDEEQLCSICEAIRSI
ncbi:MAG: flavodoxin family protein [Sphaerochaetaceae bacterium]